MRSRPSGSGAEFPIFRISPVLESYGGDPVPDGYANYQYRCPFHGDRQASATVNTADPGNEWFNCHASDCPTGNAVQIIMKQEGMAYGAAIERAETIAGASDTPVRRTSGRGSRMAGGSRNRSGSRTFKRTWRSS